MQNESIITIARRTGFSASTVSRVLNGRSAKYRISEKTARTILDEAERCGYRPNTLAKGLRTNRTFTIGLIIPSIDNPYFAEISNRIISRAKGFGYTVMAIDTMENESNESDGVSTLLGRKVDGLIAVPAGKDPELLERVQKNGTPVVLIDRHYENSTLPFVCSDNYRGGYDATEYLIGQGHRRIRCIQGVRHSMPSLLRTEGYIRAMKDFALDEYIDIAGDNFSIEDGYTHTRQAVLSSEPPTAVFALSNTIALGAIKAIREAGLSVPKDISLLSFDDNPYLDFMSPAVTRMGQPTESICEKALSLLLHRIDPQAFPSAEQSALLPARLIIRDSVDDLTPR